MNRNDSEEDVVIPSQSVFLEGGLTVPRDAQAVVLFAHGSGSSRFSPRNRLVAKKLNDAGFATLLCDLLSQKEHTRDAVTAEYRFNIPLLAKRLTGVIDWLQKQERTRLLPVCLFGASTGTAAALIAAAERPQAVRAVVSRGGRPDLAGDILVHVQAPTLLMVGGWDKLVYTLNEQAAEKLRATHQIVVVPEASHLFEEPGKLEEVARYAIDWFTTYAGEQRHLFNDVDTRPRLSP
ncbi:MAG TPA: alpha/beta fold hydrolase [Gammaproteobacteria bacterium]